MVTQDREALLAEGEQRDEQRAKIQVGEGLLRVGVTWDVIEAATGLIKAGFQALKVQLSDSGS